MIEVFNIQQLSNKNLWTYQKLLQQCYKAEDTRFIVIGSTFFKTYDFILKIDQCIQKASKDTKAGSYKISQRLKKIRNQHIQKVKKSIQLLIDEYSNKISKTISQIIQKIPIETKIKQVKSQPKKYVFLRTKPQQPFQNQNLLKQMVSFTRKLMFQNINFELMNRLKQQLKQLKTNFQIQIQKMIKKSTYKRFFDLMPLSFIYSQINALCVNYPTTQYLISFRKKIQQELKKNQKQLNRKICKFRLQKMNFEKPIRNIKEKIKNAEQARNQPYKHCQISQSARRTYFFKYPKQQNTIKTILYYCKLMYRRNKQYSLFSLMLQYKTKMDQILQIILKKQIQQSAIKEMIQKQQSDRIKNRLRSFKRSKKQELQNYAETFESVEQIYGIYTRLIRITKIEEIIDLKTQLNIAFEKFCESVESFEYQVNTRLSMLRFGKIIPLIGLKKYIKNKQTDKQLDVYLKEYREEIKKDIEHQINRYKYNVFDESYKIIQINFHYFQGGSQQYQLNLNSIMEYLFKQVYSQQQSIIILFLIGSQTQNQRRYPHQQYQKIYKKINELVQKESQKNQERQRKGFKNCSSIKLFPQQSGDPYFYYTYIRPYFYLTIKYTEC